MTQNAIETLESRTLFAAVSKFSDFGTAAIAPQQIQTLGSKLIFTGNTDANGRELWASDGTAAGTMLLKDTNPGPLDSGIRKFFKMGDYLYFTARTDPYMSLWRTDGTAAGTILLTHLKSYEEPKMAIFQKRLYFSDGHSLWKTDGTPGGTTAVTNFGIADDLPFGGPDTLSLRVAGKSLYVLVGEGLKHTLWRTYGTSTTTTKFGSFYNESDGRHLESIGNDLYFTGKYAGQTGLWKVGENKTFALISPIHKASDFAYEGTTAYFLGVEDGQPWGLYSLSNEVSQPLAWTKSNINTHIEVLNHKVFFDTTYDANISIYDIDTQALTDTSGLTSQTYHTYLGPVVGGRIYFLIDPSYYELPKEIWSTDGTEAGTARIQSYDINATYGTDLNIEIAQLGSRIYFPGKDKTFRTELTSANLNGKSSKLVYDLTGRDGYIDIYKTTAIGGVIYSFVWQEDFSLPGVPNYRFLWKSDGISPATLVGQLAIGSGYDTNFYQVGSKIVLAEGTSGTRFQTIDSSGMTAWGRSYGIMLGVLNNKLLISGYRYTEPSKILFSDGSPNGGKEMQLPEGWRAVSKLQVINNIGYFLIYNETTNKFDVWKTDGTIAGTQSLGMTGLFGSSAVSETQYILALRDGSLCMVERTSNNGSTSVDKLYMINARKQRFISVKIGSGDPFLDSSPVVLGETAKGLAIDLGSVGGLVVGDATATGTTKLISGSKYSGRYSYLSSFNGNLYFTDDNHLYVTDGTAAGTHVITGINSKTGSMKNVHAVIKDSKLYFLCSLDQILYQIEGTIATKIVSVQVVDSAPNGAIDDALVLDGKIFFSAFDANQQEYLYVCTDTTPPAHSITGSIYNDTNRNGRQDAGETGVSGLRVFIDANLNGRYDRGDTLSITDANGIYSFDHLTEGVFNLRATIASPWTPSTPKLARLTYNGTQISRAFGVYK